MKNKKLIFLIGISVLITIIFITIFTSRGQYINIEDTKLLWNVYDMNIENIKNNLDPITVPNENFFWWELKDFDIEDDYYENSLNTLVSDIRMCYLELTDDGERYTNSNPIRNYRDKKEISKEELEILNFNMNNENWCINRFNRYSNIVISNNKEDMNNFISKVNKMLALNQKELLRKEHFSYNELLARKITETTILEDLSEYVEDEYYRLK